MKMKKVKERVDYQFARSFTIIANENGSSLSYNDIENLSVIW